MKTPQDLITDAQIDIVWGNANFGDIEKRTVIAQSLLRYACGYSTGKTAELICANLGLVHSGSLKLKNLGKHYLFASFSKKAIIIDHNTLHEL